MNKKINIGLLLISLIAFMLICSINVSAELNEDYNFEPKGDLWNEYKGNVSISVSENGLITLNNLKNEENKEQVLKGLKKGTIFLNGLMTLILVGVLAFLFTKLASSGENAVKRKEVQKSILWALIAIAALGSVAALVALAFRFF